jgi:hypothetical protein
MVAAQDGYLTKPEFIDFVHILLRYWGNRDRGCKQAIMDEIDNYNEEVRSKGSATLYNLAIRLFKLNGSYHWGQCVIILLTGQREEAYRIEGKRLRKG